MSEPAWRPVRRVRAFEEVLTQIEERIAAGHLRPGDRLPGERQLAELIGVSRASVREAMRVLEARGVLTAQTGSGPEAGAILTSEPQSALADVLRLHIGLTNLSMPEVIEARMMIERWAAGLATVHPRPDQLSRMRDAVERMADRSITPAEFSEYDTAFHVALAEASGNRLLAHLMQALRDSVSRGATHALERLGDWPDGADVLRDDHARILAAIEAGDSAAAARAIGDHLRCAYPEVDSIRGELPA